MTIEHDRTLWSGTLDWGFVRIPVLLHPRVVKRPPDCRLVDRRDRTPIRVVPVNRESGEELRPEDMARAFPVSKDDYLVVQNEEWKRAAQGRSRTIRLLSFAHPEEVRPESYETPYYLEAAPGGEKAFALVLHLLGSAGKVGIAKVVFRQRERLAILGAQGAGIALNTIRFADELKRFHGMDAPRPTLQEAGITVEEFDAARRLMEAMSFRFNSRDYRDEYREELARYLRRRAIGDGWESPRQKSEDPPKPPPGGDLLRLLLRSLKKSGPRKARRGSRTA
jgi:DNA end-binding protein Ku